MIETFPAFVPNLEFGIHNTIMIIKEKIHNLKKFQRFNAEILKTYK
ncbi:MAG: hypothetical protein OEM28_01820 [Nitrosopumilus sp.]|nr:hypothetical protein [Nitrosopumilus sp.]MDH3487815.1 hypothetical protein [Nitrosopumilus sp.]